MVAGGIGAGILIVMLEVLYYKQKGWRKQQREVLKRTTKHWQDKVIQSKRKLAANEQKEAGLHAPNGSINLLDVKTKANGINNYSNHSKHSNHSNHP